MRKLGVFLLFMALPIMAHAEHFYWGLMVGKTEYEDPALKASLFTGTGRFGWQSIPFFALEGRIAATTGEDIGNLEDLRLDYLGSALAKLMIPFGDRKKVNLYAVGGISTYRISYLNLGQTTYFTDEGISYGVGIDLFSDGVNGINFEWMQYADEESNGVSYTLNSYSIGYIRRF